MKKKRLFIKDLELRFSFSTLPITTMAIGEEGKEVSTAMVGEEGKGPKPIKK